MATPTLEDFKQLGRRDKRQPCKIAEAVAGLTPGERKSVLEAVGSSSDDVRRGALLWLSRPPRNVRISNAALQSHRTERCKCHPLA